MAVLSKKGFSRIINGKKFGAFLKYAVVIFALVFAGLAAPMDAASPKIATIADYTEPYNDLDPSAGYSQEITILQNVYETLTRYSAQEKKPVPLLAESWSSSADGKTWIFKIRQGVKFHDGSDLDSSVVKKSIERTINMKKGASFIWDPVEKIETPDDHTVVFVLKNPAPVDIIASSGYAAYIISPKAVENDGEWFNEGKQDGGSGPYMLVRAQRREQAIVKKFDDYWRGWTDDQLDGAIFQIYSESSSRRQLIEKGDVHITYMLSASDMKALQQNPDVTVYESPSWKNIIGFWNT